MLRPPLRFDLHTNRRLACTPYIPRYCWAWRRPFAASETTRKAGFSCAGVSVKLLMLRSGSSASHHWRTLQERGDKPWLAASSARVQNKTNRHQNLRARYQRYPNHGCGLLARGVVRFSLLASPAHGTVLTLQRARTRRLLPVVVAPPKSPPQVLSRQHVERSSCRHVRRRRRKFDRIVSDGHHYIGQMSRYTTRHLSPDWTRGVPMPAASYFACRLMFQKARGSG